MVRLNEHEQKLAKAEADLKKAKSPMRKRDLQKYIRRLKYEMRIAKHYLDETYAVRLDDAERRVVV